MISVSNAYKRAMSKTLRDRAYLNITVGVINQDAQNNGSATADTAYWSKGNVFDADAIAYEYATLEENYMRLDGGMYFMPEEAEEWNLMKNGVVTDGFLGSIRLDFPQVYALKGITLDFGSAYPTEFRIETAEKTLVYTNNQNIFATDDVLGDTNYVLITPIAMQNENQRFRIYKVTMGIGLSYTNKNVKSLSVSEFVSSISNELPSEDVKFEFYDTEDKFDVDDENSFISFLDTMQKISISFGMTLENGNVEWHKVATGYLKDWSSNKGIVKLSATDRLAHMVDKYTLGNRIYDRTAYEEAVSIFTDAGMEPDEYFIDDSLNDIVLHNPMPEGTHKSCLQVLANACRCIVRQNPDGVIMIVANFANVLDPTDLTLDNNGVAAWSKPLNVLSGATAVYADMTSNFTKADAEFFLLPEDGNYLETGYVSGEISKADGTFDVNPTFSILLPAAFTYFNISMNFAGNPPLKMIIHTYHGDTLLESTEFYGLSNDATLIHEFADFDKMVFEFVETLPHNRIVVDKVSFSDMSDYILTKSDMLSKPTGYKDKQVKAVQCKIYTFYDDNGKPAEVEDNVFSVRALGVNGEVRTIQNPLVNTREHAEKLTEWIGNYYSNNISYDVEYRGDPRNNAGDIIHMESDKLNNLQVEITKHTIDYNGAFRGKMELRRALKMTEV